VELAQRSDVHNSEASADSAATNKQTKTNQTKTAANTQTHRHTDTQVSAATSN
jgi:hypothetical protein